MTRQIILYQIRLFLYVFFLIFSLSLFAQHNTTLDSLTNSYKREQQDTNKIKTLLRIGDVYEYSNPDSALLYYNKALQLAQKINSENLLGKSHYYIGIINQAQSKFDKAIAHYFKALNLFEKTGDKSGISIVYNYLGIIYNLNNEKVKAKSYFEKSLEISKELNDKGGESCAYGNLGILIQKEGDYRKATEYYEKVLNINLELNDLLNIGIAYSSLSITNNYLGNYEKALEYAKKSIDIAKKMNNTSSILTNNITIISIYMALSKKENSTQQQQIKYLNKAEEYAIQTMKIAKKNKQIRKERDIAFLLKDIYAQLGNYEKALESSNFYTIIKDSIFTINKTKAFSELEVKYETQKKELEINNLLNKRKNDRNIVISLIVIVFLLLAFAFVVYMQKRKLKKSYSQIVEENIKALDWKKQLDKLSKNNNIEVKPKLDIKYSESGLSENKKTDIYNAIINAMEVQKLFLNPNFKSKDLAEYLNISQMYISQVLNEKFDLSFTNLVNRYRVEEAKKLFLDPKNNNITIDGISQNAGFNSVKTFNRVFKNLSGVTPSYFRETASEKQ